MSTNAVRIRVTGGVYEGTTYLGPLHEAPVTTLVPEGIVSARTVEEAERVRAAIARELATNDRLELNSLQWSLLAERVDPPTLEPVTQDGWYERTDGSVGEYVWRNRFVKLERSVASWADVPDRDDDLREDY